MLKVKAKKLILTNTSLDFIVQHNGDQIVVDTGRAARKTGRILLVNLESVVELRMSEFDLLTRSVEIVNHQRLGTFSAQQPIASGVESNGCRPFTRIRSQHPVLKY